MRRVTTLLRMALGIITLFIGAVSIVAVSWIPFRLRRAPIAGWGTTILARALLKIMNIEPVWHNRDVFANHEGFIFPNHVSYAEILIMASFAPVRYLAKAEVAKMPLIGTIAKSIGCVFVKRENKESRSAARRALGNIPHFPPIILFPEGGTGPAGPLRPFRYGAFEIVIGGQVPFLPCIVDYGEDAEAVAWGDENLLQSIYQQMMTSRKRKVIAHVVPLRPVVPLPDDDPKLMAIAIHGAMEALRVSRQDETKLVKPGI